MKLSAVLFVCCVLVNCIGFSLANYATQVTPAALGVTVQFVNATYDITNSITTFYYTLTTTPTSFVSHFLVASSACTPSLSLVPSEWIDETSGTGDRSTGQFGYVYVLGQGNSQTVTYALSFDGSVEFGTSALYVKSGSSYAQYPGLVGPQCAGSAGGNAFSQPNPCPTAPSSILQCGQNFLPSAGSASGTLLSETNTTQTLCSYDVDVLRVFYAHETTSINAYTICSVLYEVRDTLPPALSGADYFDTINCTDALPAIPTVTAVDLCQGPINVPAPCTEQTNGTCPNNNFFLRTWTATDACGNAKCRTQTIAVVDYLPPTLIGVPANNVTECVGYLNFPAAPVVTAQDNCQCNGSLTTPVQPQHQYEPGECPNTGSLLNTWTTTDCCGNSASASQLLVIEDTTKPNIWLNSPNGTTTGTFQCDDVTVYTASTYDICMNSSAHLTNTTTRINGSCPNQYYLQTVYSACDDCGNTNNITSLITIIDNVFPTWVTSTLPQNYSTECGNVTEPPNPQASDTCGSATVTRLPDIKNPGLCPNEYVIIRTWSAADACNNTIYWVQSVTVIDTTPTYINPVTLPVLGPYQCGFDVPAPSTTVTALPCSAPSNDPGLCTQCSTAANLSSVDFIINGSCPNNYTLIRTYTLTDCSDNTNSLNTTIIVLDTTPPVLSNTPLNVTQQCNNTSNYPQVNMSDLCDCNTANANCHPVNHNQFRVNGSCPYQYFLVNTWSTTDICGLSSSYTATISVIDPFYPVFVSPPADINATCDAVPPKTTLTATVPCGDATVDNSIPDTRYNGSCPNQYRLEHVWTATDDCNHVSSYTQTVYVSDNSAPNITGVPNNTEANCSLIPYPAPVCASDVCDGIELSYNQLRTNYSTCTAGSQYFYWLNRTWVATDDCSNVASQSQIINVYDRDAPYFTSTPTDLHQNCTNVVIPPPPGYNDNCNPVTFTNHTTSSIPSCPNNYSIFVSYEIQDFCGNTAWYNFTIYVSDSYAPQFVNPPPQTPPAYSCTPPAPYKINLTDSCDDTPSLAFPPTDDNTTVICPNTFNFTRTYTASDECSNTNTYIQYISVTDYVKPTWTSSLPNATETYSCSAPPAAPLSAVDNCAGSLTAYPVQTNISQNATCVYNYVYNTTWTVSDACSNTISYVQTVTVQDIEAPTIVCAGDGLLDCFNTQQYQCAPLSPPDVCASDECTGLTAVYNATITQQTCQNKYLLTRTWVATDLCHNTVTQTQLNIINDTFPPVWSSTPPSTQYNKCVLPTLLIPTASDTCSDATVFNDSYVIPGQCINQFDYIVNYTTSDACNNFAAPWTYTVHVYNNATPTVTWSPAGAPAPQTFACGQEPVYPTPSVQDACGNQGSFTNWTVLTVPPVGTCSYIYTKVRHWNITDVCHNTLSFSQTIVGNHTIPPTFNSVPQNTNSTCGTPVPYPIVYGTDSCGAPLTATNSTTFTNGSCIHDYYETRTWILTDQCGLTATASQVIHWYDTSSPVITPTPVTQSTQNQCTFITPPAPTVTDLCDGTSPYNTSHVTSSYTCLYIYTQTWTYTSVDSCDNVGSVNQNVSYTWTNAPTLSNTPPVSVSAACEDDLSPPNVTAVDGCGKPLSVTYTQNRINGSCPNDYWLARLWSATDDCGLTTTYTSTVTVTDTEYPHLCGVPASTSVQCGFVPTAANVTASDNCPGVNLTYNETILPGGSCCDYTITRVWVAEDACGHILPMTQTISVHDDVFPVLIVPPNEGCIACPFASPVYTAPTYNVTAYKPALATGYCSDGSIRTSTGCTPPAITPPSVNIGGSPVTLTVLSATYIEYYFGYATLTASLSGSDGKSYTLTAVLNDTEDYVNSSTPFMPMYDGCYTPTSDPSLVSPTTWTFYSALSGNITNAAGGIVAVLTNTAQPSQSGVGADLNLYQGLLLLANANGAPVTFNFDLLKDGQPGCSFNQTELPELCACATNVTVNYTQTNVTTCPGDYVLTNKWCVIDEVGHVVCHSQTVQICDESKPLLILSPPSGSIDCNDTAYLPTVTHNSSCTLTNLTSSSWTVNGSCPNAYTLYTAYTATDECGLYSTATFSLSVSDHIPPTISGLPANGYVESQTCNGSWPLPDVCATDQCDGVNVTYTQTNVTLCPYNFTLIRLYTAIDVCDNIASSSYSVSVSDPYYPVFSNVPIDVTQPCNQSLPTANPTASHPCQGSLTVNGPFDSYDNNTCGLPTITRTWTASDACGMSSTATQIITLVDTFNPVWIPSTLPQNVTVNCTGVPTVVNPSATDICGQIATTYYNGEIQLPGPQNCNNSYILQRSWNATDCSGNYITWVAFVTVVDYVPPVITTNVTNGAEFGPIDCKDVPAPPPFCASDNCDGVSLTYAQTRFNYTSSPICDQYLLTRTVVAVDDCGNSAKISYTLYVNNTQAPTCVNVEADSNYTCENPDHVPAPPTCTSHCEGPITPTLSNSTVPGSCTDTYTRVYTYKATDSCGNFNTYTTNVFIADHTAPTFQNVPSSGLYECHAPIPSTDVTTTDNCDTSPTLSPYYSLINASCADLFTILQYWNSTDRCGNFAQTPIVNWTWVDSYPPYWTSSLPASTTVQCDGVPDIATVTAADNCTEPMVTFTNVTFPGSCANEYKIERRWVAEDCVGHAISYTQTITVIDTQSPSISPAPPAGPFQCASDVPAPPAICTTDVCAGIYLNYTQIQTNLSTSSPTCANRFQLNRTWLATDLCGNQNVTSQIITVDDTTAPNCSLAYLLASGPIPCEDRDNVNLNLGPCTDNCAGPAHVINYTTITPGCYPTVVYNISYYVYDDCGNGVWYNSSAWVTDNVQLFLDTENALHNNTVSCTNVTPFVFPDYNASCGATPTFNYTNQTTFTGGCQDYNLTWQYFVYSPCGDVITKTMFTQVIDTIPPVLSPVSNWTLSCQDEIVVPIVTATDSCGTATVAPYTQIYTPGNCANRGTYTYTWVATDLCGNQASTFAVLTITDDFPPNITQVAMPVVNVNCTYVPPPPEICCSDSCNGVYMNYTEVRINSSICDAIYTLNRTWVCNDVCGHAVATNQIVNVADQYTPTFNAPYPPETITYECNAVIGQSNMTAYDSCTGVTVNQTETHTQNGCLFNYTLYRSWVATDACGNTNTYYQNATVQDTHKPYAYPTTPICYAVSPLMYNMTLEVPNLTVLNNIFSGYDNCSDVTISFYSCSSNLDYLSTTIGDLGCRYNASTDTLYLSAFVPIDSYLPGRLYNVTVLITDACNYSVPASYLIFLPNVYSNVSAQTYFNLTDLDTSTCITQRASCNSACPCQTVDHYCNANGTYGQSLTLANYYTNSDASTTTFSFSWTSAAGSPVPGVLTLGLDLSKYQIISVVPDSGVELGYQPGTVLSGITWTSINKMSTPFLFNVTVAGNFPSGPGTSTAQFLASPMEDWDNAPVPCTSLLSLSSLGNVSYPSSTASITGQVRVAGVMGSSVSLALGLRGALVALVTDVSYTDSLRSECSSYGTPLQMTLTDADGNFAFSGLSAGQSYQVAVLQDGFFRVTNRAPSAFLTASSGPTDILSQPLGCPQNTTAPSAVNFDFYVNPVANPSYARSASDTGFEGDSLPVAVWSYCINYPAACTAMSKHQLTVAKFSGSYLIGASCFNSLSFSPSATTLQQSLLAATYNVASGRGIFQPYDAVQWWFLEFAKAVVCDTPTPDSASTDLATTLLGYINGATDLDRLNDS